MLAIIGISIGKKSKCLSYNYSNNAIFRIVQKNYYSMQKKKKFPEKHNELISIHLTPLLRSLVAKFSILYKYRKYTPACGICILYICI
jgi:hypothetical protein